MTDNFSPKALQRKIDAFCQLRLSSFLTADEFDRLRGYMRMLIQTRTLPPRINGCTDWSSIAGFCGVEIRLLATNERLIDPGLDAIARWIKGTAVSGKAPTKPTQKSKGNAAQEKPLRAAQSQPVRKQTVWRGSVVEPSFGGTAPADRAFVEFPTPLFDQWIDPPDFAEALQLHLRRHDETYWKLYRAIIGPDEPMAKGTLLSWMEGRRVPRSTDSFEVLGRIERRYRLPEGYFKAKLPHPSRSASGFNLSGIDPAERRRMAWHLPEDFNSLSFQKREEIVEWVRRVVISGSTDYRQFQAAAVRQRYAIRFPGVSYGGQAQQNGKIAVPVDDEQGWIEDPDLLSGVIDAPPALAMEMADLVRFKTSALTSIVTARLWPPVGDRHACL